MSQLKSWSCDRHTNVRAKPGEAAPREGTGKHTRIYTGRSGIYFYRSYLRFNLDWTNVGRIVSAHLVLYTDDDGSTFDAGTEPKLLLRRLTGTFGSKTDGTLDTYYTTGWTKPANTTADQFYIYPTVVTDSVNRYDITKFVNAWAPKGVTRSDGKTNSAPAGNYGIFLADADQTTSKWAWAGWGKEAATPGYRPTIELVYEYGATTPDTPTNLAPSGTIASFDNFVADFGDPRSDDELRYAQVQVYNSAGTTKLWDVTEKQSNAAITAAQAQVSIDKFPALKARTTYRWRIRYKDQEGQWSAWSTPDGSLASAHYFYISNTQPVVSAMTPASGSSRSTLSKTLFGATYTDADGDRMMAYQIQLGYAPTANWDTTTNLVVWDSGKVFVPYWNKPSGSTYRQAYTGPGLDAGTWYWRTRVWDKRGYASEWSADQTLTLSAAFEPEPGVTAATLMPQPKVPFRILIKDMGANRGPGETVAIIENAKKVGATQLYNSPGELHFTLPVDHPQVSVIEPRQTHYALEFRHGDGWREVYAGLITDFDATEREVIFYGVDYLGLYDYVYDERYDPANPDKPYDKGGSKYIDKTLKDVVVDQLTRAKGLANSPVGFITVSAGNFDAMDEKVTVFSTMQPCLQFATGLIESHRQGTGALTRLSVQKSGGSYLVRLNDDPGTTRDELRLSYGELVQGYRIIPFGDWATVQHGIGRTRDGIRVLYKTESTTAVAQSTWGRFAKVNVYDGVSDENDLTRRVKQDALHAGKIGKQVGLSIRSNMLLPFDGYTIGDDIPVAINHGVVNTAAYGSGYWTILGVTFQTDDKNHGYVTLSLAPREDTVAPDADLIPTRPISPQAEWQVGWSAPDVVNASARYWLDQNTGEVYERNESLVTDPGAITGLASTDTFTLVAHGYNNNDIVYLYNLTGGTGLTEFSPYYVINKTADTFQLSASLAGPAVNFTTDVTAGTVQNAPTYDSIAGTEVMAPPPIPGTPTAPTLTSDVQGGVVRVKVAL